MNMKSIIAGAAAMLSVMGSITISAHAEDAVKVGVVIPMTGGFQSNGRQINAALKTYVATHGDTAGGKKVEFIVKDDASSPDNALRISQELVTNDKVSILTGFGNTPTALAVAQLSKRAKIPQVIMVAATSSIMKASPYMLRTSWTIPQVASVIGKWAPENGTKKFVSIVSTMGRARMPRSGFRKRCKKTAARLSLRSRCHSQTLILRPSCNVLPTRSPTVSSSSFQRAPVPHS